MLNNFLVIFRDEEGQGLVEYALIIVLVALVVFGFLQAVGTDVGQTFTDISTKLKERP